MLASRDGACYIGPSMERAANASFVFHGTVVQPGASTMPNHVSPSGATAIVRVDEVVYAPPVLANYSGQHITVLLQDRERVAAGETATFYTNATIFGDSVAVQSMGHQDVDSARASLPALTGDPVQNTADRKLRAHVTAAETVVTGTVTSTHLASAPAAAMELAATPGPISEHDPEWHDAVVTVSIIEKGGGGGGNNQIVVRYPNSMDVRWYQVPKLRPGMTGSFILHAMQSPEAAHAVSAGLRASIAPAAPQPQFVLLHPEDFQPHDQVERVRAMISPPRP
jgi:hypothetical protein